MDEFFLQYLWRFQKFESQKLQLTDGTSLTVLQTGYQNDHAGPDFAEAKVKIDELLWSGSVEIHYKSSDWKRHQHHKNRAYENVILHVVWLHDEEVTINGQPIPTFEMSPFVADTLESSYRKYINQPETIRCSEHLPKTPQVKINAMLDRALASRLEQKSQRVLETLKATSNDWEEATYRTIARNFGFKTNATPFTQLAETLPYSLLRKHHHQPDQVFALIFGMSGFLGTAESAYQEKLKREFDYLKKKYRLERKLDKFQWKYARMRPANFPSVRLAQFASVISGQPQLFAQLVASESLRDVQKMVRKSLPEYWREHYDFGKPSARNQQIGKSSIENIIINSLAPILAAYSRYLGEQIYLERAQKLLEELPAEKNQITKKWKSADIIPQHAADSQALLYQYQEFCIKKRCLNCNIGISVLDRS